MFVTRVTYSQGLKTYLQEWQIWILARFRVLVRHVIESYLLKTQLEGRTGESTMETSYEALKLSLSFKIQRYRH